MKSTYTTRRAVFSRIALLVLLTATLRAHSDVTVTYMSVEPIPSQDVIGEDALATIENAGYRTLARWSERLLDDCNIVQRVIDALDDAGAISTCAPWQHQRRGGRRWIRGRHQSLVRVHRA